VSADFPTRAFLFVRHGQTDWNAAGRFQGHTDVPLNDAGRRQAEAVAEMLKRVPFARIVSSPLIRARDTAEAIAGATGRPLHIEDELIECNFGSLEGACYAEVMTDSKHPKDLIGLLAPDGEQWAEVLVRARLVVGRWLDAYPAETLLFVAHDALLQALSEVLCGEWFRSRHAVPYWFEPGRGIWAMTELRADIEQ
jgi:probable phosphoglycerate mutase